MGGHAAGEIAARIALETLDAAFHESEKNGDFRVVVNTLYDAAARANQEVIEAGTSREGCDGMGCTLAGVVLMGRGYVVFHAGDSRVFRFRRGALRQLTEDDTLVALAVRSGRMTPEEAESSPSRHYVTNATGASSFELHVAEPQSLRPGDTLAICSDGLHGMMDFETMERLLSQGGSVAERCAALAAEAVRRGGHDNISVILVDAEAPEDADTPEDPALHG
jgi:protein phosphatase